MLRTRIIAMETTRDLVVVEWRVGEGREFSEVLGHRCHKWRMDFTIILWRLRLLCVCVWFKWLMTCLLMCPHFRDILISVEEGRV